MGASYGNPHNDKALFEIEKHSKEYIESLKNSDLYKFMVSDLVSKSKNLKDWESGVHRWMPTSFLQYWLKISTYPLRKELAELELNGLIVKVKRSGINLYSPAELEGFTVKYGDYFKPISKKLTA
jgi:hypothetical protein